MSMFISRVLDNLSGKTFGRLFVLSRDKNKRGDRFTYWKCVCKCGNKTTVRRDHLIKSTKSCGCIIKERMRKRRKNILGQRFGRLIVLRIAKANKHNQAPWLCKCDCGNTTTAFSSNLLNGTHKSCGCLRGKINTQNNTKICTACKRQLSVYKFGYDKRHKDGVSSKCHNCLKIIREEYISRFPEKIKLRKKLQRKYAKKWYERNKFRTIRKMWANSLKINYGITVKFYNEMLKQQNYSCAICLAIHPGRNDKHFTVDHDHQTGKVRGLLCQTCNTGIGMFKENLKFIVEAAKYVARASEQIIRI